MSKDIPIIFSAPMVRALLDGRKTQTRRLAWRDAGFGHYSSQKLEEMELMGWHAVQCCEDDEELFRVFKPTAWQNAKPGDRLWVRENITRFDRGSCCQHVWYWAGDNDESYVRDTKVTEGKWPLTEGPAGGLPYSVPCIHMPRRASRLTLIVTDVKIERLQDITRDDAIAEGCTSREIYNSYNVLREVWSMDWSRVGKFSRFATGGPGKLREHDISLADPVEAFGSFLNELHGGENWNLDGKPTPLWDQNPFVVAISFKAIMANIDAPESRISA